jgi:hypothetical protein
MANWPERAATALTVYFERGVRAMEHIRLEQWEDVDRTFSMRKAAFHNFRAADHLALQTGYTPEQELQLRLIWRKIAVIDVELLCEMEKAQGKMQAEMSRMVKVKSAIGHFKSGQFQESKMEKPV